MKKSLFILASMFLLGIMVHAQETSLFSENDFTYYDYNGAIIQDWVPASMLTLKVHANTSVYITNYISNWYGTVEDLGAADYVAGYDMSANKYGYRFAETDAEGNVKPVGQIYYANGETKPVTYTNKLGKTQTTEGYFLGDFDKDAEIFFVMTPRGFGELNSYDPVDESDSDPTNPERYASNLQSRQINTWDQNGLIRVNFGVTDHDPNTIAGTANFNPYEVGHEFVLAYAAKPPQPVGSPLPGSLLSSLVFMGTAAFGSRFRKRSKK